MEDKLRSGNLVLYVSEDGNLHPGLVTTIWKGGKKKRVTPLACEIGSLAAFRVVKLEHCKDGVFFSDCFGFIFEFELF